MKINNFRLMRKNHSSQIIVIYNNIKINDRIYLRISRIFLKNTHNQNIKVISKLVKNLKILKLMKLKFKIRVFKIH